MPSIDFDSIFQTTSDQGKELAKTLFKKYVDQAVSDIDEFVKSSREGVERAIRLYADGQIDQDDLEDLILGKKDLALMRALKQQGLATAAVDTFVHGVLNILVEAIFAAVKI